VVSPFVDPSPFAAVSSPGFLGVDLPTWRAILVSVLLGAFVGVITGFIGSLLANRAYETLLSPLLEVREDPGGPAVGANPSIGPLAFFHVAVFCVPPRFRLLGPRRPARHVRADIVIWDISRRNLQVVGSARWAGWPEPVALVQVQAGGVGGPPILAPAFDPREHARQRSFSFETSEQIEQLDLVLKVEGQDEVFFWNNDNYRYGWLYSGHRLSTGDYHVEVTLRYEGRVTGQWFLLENKGPSWRNVRIARIARRPLN